MYMEIGDSANQVEISAARNGWNDIYHALLCFWSLCVVIFSLLVWTL